MTADERGQAEMTMTPTEYGPVRVKDGVVDELPLGSPLNAISLSRDQRHGVVGGRDLMKVLFVLDVCFARWAAMSADLGRKGCAPDNAPPWNRPRNLVSVRACLVAECLLCHAAAAGCRFFLGCSIYCMPVILQV